MSAAGTKILKYTLLPGIVPRLFSLFTSGFSFTAYLIATIYQSLRLLPADHPYLNPQNMGRYGIRHVIAAAANNLVISKKNIDQTVLFFTILIGLVLLFLQFILLAISLVTQPVFAASIVDIFSVTSQYAPGGASGAFQPATDPSAIGNYPAQDLAFIILDNVFGMQNIFNSCVSVAEDCRKMNGDIIPRIGVYPTPFHTALHTLFQFYSLGIFVVSVFIILYIIIVAASETAATGTPFGQRFNKTWVPVRFVVFFALLMPLNVGQTNSGINGAQLITLWSAKHGSAFATNAWGRFNNELNQTAGATLLGKSDDMVATPNIPQVDTLAQFIFTARTCKIAEETAYNYTATKPDGIQPYVVREHQRVSGVSVPDHILFDVTNFDVAADFTNNKTITIAFGLYDPTSEKAKAHKGAVIPYCGTLQIFIAEAQDAAKPQTGANQIQSHYYSLIQQMWSDTDMVNRATCVVAKTYKEPANYNCNPTDVTDKDFVRAKINEFENAIRGNLQSSIQTQINSKEWDVNANIGIRGWAGASLWYNRIAEVNGDIANTIQNVPKPSEYPYVLEYIRAKRLASNEGNADASLFNPILANGERIHFKRERDAEVAPPISAAYEAWGKEEALSGSMIIDFINQIFGTSAMFDMRKNADIHPLAQLSMLGKSMMEASVRNIAFGLPGELLLQSATKPAGMVGKAAASFLKKLGTTTLSLSFILYYVLPFLPFIYFIFALSGWIKSIFEAMVAMPLWALAHLRVDGEGLPGSGAVNGYFLILEIFLRPILILFGLIASISIFSALVSVMNEGLFEMVVQNVGGYDKEAELAGGFIPSTDFFRGPIDQFFYTAMYVIIVYMLGLGSFKLIDAIPDKIMRWAGVTVAAFQENAGDPAGQVIQKSYQGTLLATNQIEGGVLAAIS